MKNDCIILLQEWAGMVAEGLEMMREEFAKRHPLPVEEYVDINEYQKVIAKGHKILFDSGIPKDEQDYLVVMIKFKTIVEF